MRSGTAILLLLCGLVTARGGTVERYAELFPGSPSNQPLSSVGWQAHGSSSATPLTGADAQIATANGAPDASLSFVVGGNQSPWLLWTTEPAGIDFDRITHVRWHQGNAVATNALRVAIKIGGQWLASTATFSQSSGLSTGTAFAARSEPMTLTLSAAASAWRRLDFVPGSQLALTSTPPSADLSGQIEALGFFAGTVTGALRVDSVRLLDSAPRGADWERTTIDFINSTADGADGVRIWDWNGDAHPDLVAGWEEAGEVRVYANPGPEAIQGPWQKMVLGPSPGVEDVLPADWDGDGRQDLAAMLEAGGEKIRLWFAPASPGDLTNPALWQPVDIADSTGRRWMFAIALDVDGDGDLDLVAGGKESNAEVAWFRNPGSAASRNGNEWTRFKMTDANWIMSLHLRDMNADGHPDVLISDRKPGGTNRQGIRWLENPGPAAVSGTWTSHMVHPGMEVMFIEPEDVNGDGHEDILWGSVDPARLGWLERNPDGSYLAHPIEMPANVGRPKHFRAANLVPGQRLYVLTFERAYAAEGLSGVVWMVPPSDPSNPIWRVGEISGSEGDKFDLAALLDLDGDGDLDLITSDEGEAVQTIGLGVVWFRNPGAKALAFTFPEFLDFFGVGLGPNPATEDADGDGLPELMEYAFNSDPTNPSPGTGPFPDLIADGPNQHLALTYLQRSGGSGRVGLDYAAGGVEYRVQQSTDISAGSWQSEAAGLPLTEPVGSPIPATNGTEWVTVRSTEPANGILGREFLRLRLQCNDSE